MQENKPNEKDLNSTSVEEASKEVVDKPKEDTAAKPVDDKSKLNLNDNENLSTDVKINQEQNDYEKQLDVILNEFSNKMNSSTSSTTLPDSNVTRETSSDVNYQFTDSEQEILELKKKISELSGLKKEFEDLKRQREIQATEQKLVNNIFLAYPDMANKESLLFKETQRVYQVLSKTNPSFSHNASDTIAAIKIAKNNIASLLSNSSEKMRRANIDTSETLVSKNKSQPTLDLKLNDRQKEIMEKDKIPSKYFDEARKAMGLK